MSKLVLGIETSCDETAIALVEKGRKVHANIISSQTELHRPYGGVVPELASREHLSGINFLLEEAFLTAGLSWKDIDAVAVTYGPGLVGALLVGVTAAKAIAYALKVPLVGVNHLEGHINANYLTHQDLEPPFIALVVSGGHTDLVMVTGYRNFEVLGQTRDDAAGEAFDKVARVLGLGYPGGPAIEAAAQQGDHTAISFPRAVLKDNSCGFSFSGLKTAVTNHVNRLKQKKEPIPVHDIAAGFQASAVEALVEQTINVAEEKETDTIVVCGGVAANKALRERFMEKAIEAGKTVRYPDLILCTDNAAMIASAGYYRLQEGLQAPLTLNAVPNLSIGEERYTPVTCKR